MGKKKTRRRRAPAAPPPNALWLIACHGPSGTNTERMWCRYAHRSNPGFVWRMNNTRYNHSRPAQGEHRPAGRLSTLGPAVTSLSGVQTTQPAALVLFWHGIPPFAIDRDSSTPASLRQFYVAVIHSTGQAVQLDANALTADQSQHPWNDRVFPFGWANRNQNQHYQAAVQAIRSLQNISVVHLYGCQLGDQFYREPLRDFTADVGKEVWAYSGYTATATDGSWLQIVQSHGSTSPEDGARQDGTGYRTVSLRADRGLLPGWQVRGRHSGGNVLIDVYESVMGSVDTYQRGQGRAISSSGALSSGS